VAQSSGGLLTSAPILVLQGSSFDGADQSLSIKFELEVPSGGKKRALSLKPPECIPDLASSEHFTTSVSCAIQWPVDLSQRESGALYVIIRSYGLTSTRTQIGSVIRGVSSLLLLSRPKD